MLSHFRIHRRGPSNPSSPLLDQSSPLDHAEHPNSSHDLSNRPDFLARPTNAASTPPLHPTGPWTDPDPTPDRKPSEQSLKESSSPSVRSPQPPTGDSGFIGGLALENYRRALGVKRDDSSAVGQHSSRSKPLPPPIDTNLPSAHPPPVAIKELRSRSSFVAPTELQNNAGATGKRPSGARLTSEPSALSSSQSVTESQKGKKGLPFLKNPMSGLLMRRKASQNAPDLRPLPLPQKPVEATYDPRIRGTRVHDFSAPRQRVVPTRKPTVPGAEVWSGIPSVSSAVIPDLASRSPTGRSSSAVSEKTQPGASDTESQRPFELSKESSRKSTAELKRVSLDDKPLPAQPESSSGENVDAQGSASPSWGPGAATDFGSIRKANPLTRTNKSRHISLSGGSVKDGVALALPKHMKSTSSRFSFDMMGAARAEKALEERHRQKELERNANNPTTRDSRFDDFDEDSFDYDAAMAEDGFEEDIPMVGDDDFFDDDAFFEEDVPVVGDDDMLDAEDDPDNDQENFAGFVFQRSNPQSSLASPAPETLVPTPRDATGNAIGYAMTKDTTPELRSATSPLANLCVREEGSVGVDDHSSQPSEAPRKTGYDPTVFQERRHPPVDDGGDLAGTADKELYFDEGLLEELRMEADEIQTSTFDESIFDMDDTDQYGRPIPGAFAQAQAQATKTVQDQEVQKRESDITSASGLSGSTAHTSVSLGLQPMPSMTEKGRELSSQTDAATVTSPTQIPTEGKVAAYQAALAEAAHKAAAAGWKFKWEDQQESPLSPSPSPPLPPPQPPVEQADPDFTITSPTTDSQPSSGGQKIDNGIQGGYDEYADYDDGFGGVFDDNFDDEFEFDDDFIAEANAEALAYDSDGFYGQEFGFYSVPIPQGHHGAAKSGGLTNENVYGGYFGPSGVSRTTSGRVVSREPNLTPITERSEYSNRNSIMSLGLPLGASEGRNSLQSPGLAQLAMMTDDGKMSLAELLRLRSKAWGGSQVSLNSSREGSPRSERAPPGDRFEGTSSPAPWETGRPNSHLGLSGGSHARKNSSFSVWSNSDAASGAGSPTLTIGFSSMPNSAPPQPLFSPPPPPMPQPSPGFQCPPVIEDEEEASSPGLSTKSPTVDHNHEATDTYDANAKIDIVSGGLDAAPPPPPEPVEPPPPPPPPNTSVSSPSKRPGHRHKSSAESISYSIDEDKESGETRWVMERRRTAESGETEVLRREVVSACSI